MAKPKSTKKPPKKPAVQPKAETKPKPKKRAKRKKDAETALAALTWRQRRFVQFFLGECKGNATEAARQAGYAHPNTDGPFNLKKPSVAAAIAAKTAAVALSQDEVLARFSDIASSDLGPFLTFKRSGDVGVDLRKLKAAGLTHLIKEIKQGPYGQTIKFHSSFEALIQLGKYHGLFARTEEAGDDDGAADDIRSIRDVLNEARKRRGL